MSSGTGSPRVLMKRQRSPSQRDGEIVSDAKGRHEDGRDVCAAVAAGWMQTPYQVAGRGHESVLRGILSGWMQTPYQVAAHGHESSLRGNLISFHEMDLSTCITFGRLCDYGGREPLSSSAEETQRFVRTDRLGSVAGIPFTNGTAEHRIAAYDELLRMAAQPDEGLMSDTYGDPLSQLYGSSESQPLLSDSDRSILRAVASKHEVLVARCMAYTGLMALRAWLLFHSHFLANGGHLCMLCNCATCSDLKATSDTCPLWTLGGALLWLALLLCARPQQVSGPDQVRSLLLAPSVPFMGPRPLGVVGTFLLLLLKQLLCCRKSRLTSLTAPTQVTERRLTRSWPAQAPSSSRGLHSSANTCSLKVSSSLRSYDLPAHAAISTCNYSLQ